MSSRRRTLKTPRRWLQTFPVATRPRIKRLGRAGLLERAIPPKSQVNLGDPGGIGPNAFITVKLKKKPGKGDLKLIKNVIFQTIHKPLLKKIKKMIHKWVPYDTKNLQNDLIASVEKSGLSALQKFTTGKPWALEMSSDLEYSKIVNKMPGSWLKHPHPWSSNRGVRGQKLKDPKAQPQWYETVMANGRVEAHHASSRFERTVMKLFRKVWGRRGARGAFNRSFKITIPTGFRNLD